MQYVIFIADEEWPEEVRLNRLGREDTYVLIEADDDVDPSDLKAKLIASAG